MSALSMASLIIVLLCNKYSREDREHPCLTPLPTEQALDRPSHILTYATWL